MTRSLPDDARAIFEAAVAGVSPPALLPPGRIQAELSRPLADYRAVHVIGTGKGSMVFGGLVEAQLVPLLGERLSSGILTVPHGYRRTFPAGLTRPSRLAVTEAGHPTPDEAGLNAAARALQIARDCGPDDLLIVLITGGGSALWPAFAEGISLDDARATYGALLRCGASIHQVNAVRKHISAISGGRLAQAAAPAELLALAVSDVPGDDLSVISSGPTVPDTSTFAEARAILERYGIWQTIPASVRRRIEAGQADPALETPKPGDPAFSRARTLLLGSNATALEAALAHARTLGYDARITARNVEGEAREVGARFASELITAAAQAPATPLCLIAGGETTVTVTGSGSGGRNQELALAAALAFADAPSARQADLLLLSGGSDGVDGPTDAAGAIATPATLAQATGRGLFARQCLANNDAYPFFAAVGGHVTTGPTHMNVMDIYIGLTA